MLKRQQIPYFDLPSLFNEGNTKTLNQLRSELLRKYQQPADQKCLICENHRMSTVISLTTEDYGLTLVYLREDNQLFDCGLASKNALGYDKSGNKLANAQIEELTFIGKVYENPEQSTDNLFVTMDCFVAQFSSIKDLSDAALGNERMFLINKSRLLELKREECTQKLWSFIQFIQSATV